MADSPSLARPIGLPQATALVAGIIIGASIFVQPSEINRHVPTIPGILSVWAAAGILTLFGAQVCAELSRAYPQTGGVYVFLRETISPAFGFLWGWSMFWIVHSGIIAATSVIFARYLGFFLPLNDTGTRLAAITAIVALSLINVGGVRQGSSLQTLITAGKLLAVVLLLVMALAFGTHAAPTQADQAPPPTFTEFVLGVAAALFAFGGWHMVTYSAGETRDPKTTIPRALFIGCLIVTASYIALNAAYLYLLPLDKVTSSTRVAADAAFAVGGPNGAAIISALVLFSALGVLNGVILAGPRMYLAMANDGLAPSWIGAIHPLHRTPYRAILLQAAWASVLVATGTYRALFTRVVYTEWLFFALMAFGLLRLRRQQGIERSPLIPVVFIAASIVVAAISIAAEPVQAATGFLLVMLGLPVYYYWLRPKRQH